MMIIYLFAVIGVVAVLHAIVGWLAAGGFALWERDRPAPPSEPADEPRPRWVRNFVEQNSDDRQGAFTSAMDAHRRAHRRAK